MDPTASNLARLLQTIETDVVPLTAEGVKGGNKVGWVSAIPGTFSPLTTLNIRCSEPAFF
jgi:hypothetical protein